MTEDGGKAMKLRGTTMLYIKGASPLDRLQPDEGAAARTHAPEASPGAPEDPGAVTGRKPQPARLADYPNIETGSAGTYVSH